MKYCKANWIHELSLKHCLMDPRIDQELRKAIAVFVLEIYLQNDESMFVIAEKVTKDDVIIIYEKEFPNLYKNYIANGKSLEEKSKIRSTIKTNRIGLENVIKKIVENAFKSNGQIEVEKIPITLHRTISDYYTAIKKSWQARVNQIMESFLIETIKQNKLFSKTYQQIQQCIQTVHTSNEAFNPTVESIALSKGQFAYISSFIGRSKNLKAPYVHRQEDRARVFTDIKLHSHWENRIPELLAFVVQKFADEIYKNIPILDWSDYANSKEYNFCTTGSTLAMVFTYQGVAYVLSLGDSPVICLKRDTNGVVKSRLITWPHQVCGEYESSKSEVARIKNAGGNISDDGKRVVNPFGAMTVSRALGDMEAVGMSDIGSITIKKLNPNSILFIGSDGVFDFLSIKRMENMFEHLKTEEIAFSFCAEAFKNLRNKDNITGVVIPPLDNIFAFVADGHGGSCIAEYIYQKLGNEFKNIAENLPIDEVVKVEERKIKKFKVDSNNYNDNSFFSKTNKQCYIRTVYDKSALYTKISSLSCYQPQSVGTIELEQCLRKTQETFLIQQKDTHYFTVNYLCGGKVKQDLFYVPNEYPMSYQEFSQIICKENIIVSDAQLKQYLTALIQSIKNTVEDDELTQSASY